MKRLLVAIALFSTLVLVSQTQQTNLTPQVPQGGRTCGTDILPQQFETWLNSLPSPQTATNGPKGGGGAAIQSIYNIPVIVHIIHNNENINSVTATSGNNLNAAQVIDQINILNEDFNGLNSDTSLIPAVFKPLFGKCQINFCLAVVNPTGGILAEPGINRINRVAAGWNALPYSQTYINATVKPNSIWDPNKYLNIWVCPLSSGLLGYATFPNPGVSGLGGLPAPYGSTTSDGVVILNTSFGSIGTAQFGVYNLGRTATHEIGHWVGLRHVWGDGTCASDFCNDTPVAQTANYNCPTHPYKLGTCSGNTTGEMFQNFMDYTNDACMYMFTKDQKFRAQQILTYSTMRANLVTSTVCTLPNVVLDAGISSVSRPTYSQTVNCNTYIDPILRITNYGTTPLTTLAISYNVDNTGTQAMTWTGTANPNTTFTLAVPQINVFGNGAHLFNATITAINGGADAVAANNFNQQQFVTANQLTVTVNSTSVCAGLPTTLTASGANTYTWLGIGSGSTAIVSPSATTVYTLNASNGSCTTARQATVLVVQGPPFTVNSASACAGAQATLSASGATSYTWSTGSTAAAITVSNNASTVYTLFASNGGACNSTSLVTLSILPSPNLIANSQTICPGLTATLQASGASTYSWSSGSTGSSLIVNPAATTVYTVSGEIGTCNSLKTVTLTIGANLSLNVFPAQATVCAGTALNLNVTGATNYTWSSGGNAGTTVITPSATTNYSVVGNTAACTGTQVFSIIVNQLPITTITATNVTCFGFGNGQIAASANGNGPFTYTYSGGTSNLSAGIYSVITKDANNCNSTTTVAISQPAPLSTSTISGITSCPAACDGSFQITINGGTSPYTCTYYPGAVVASTATNVCAGNYNYVISDANACPNSGVFSVLAGNNGIAVTASASNLSCSGCNNATLTAQGTTGTAPYSYTWQPGNFIGAVRPDVEEGCYTVTVQDAFGCSNDAVVCASFDVGIEKIANNNALRLQPNPSTGVFTLTGISDKAQVSVYDARGRLILNQATKETELQINISEYEAGVYFVRVLSDKQSAVLQVLKE